MGVLKCDNTAKNADRIDMLIESCVQELQKEEVEKSEKVPKSPRRQSKKSTPAWKIDRCTPRKSRNSRRARRTENMNFLLELVEDDTVEWDLVELMEPGVSAFAELLSEQEKMKFWNDFVNHSEEDQNHFLQFHKYLEGQELGHGSHDQEKVDHCKKEKEENDDDSDFECLEDTDKRSVHPAFSAEECFDRINSRLKNLLRKRHLPKGPLEHLEEEITSFFKEWPSSVFVSHISSSFERLLVHALCQYLDLNSRSSNDEKGVRHTHVENPCDYFSPPAVSLTKFLERKE